jgi:ribonucleoside-diphosphate reductase beta chain
MALVEYSKTYFPQYQEFVEITKLHEEAHWHEGEAKLQQDVEQWKTGIITDDDKYFINSILRLFTQTDVAVAREYHEIFIPAFKNNETRNMLTSFAGREGVHQRAYALLSDTLGFGEGFYTEFLEYKEMKEKYEYMLEMSNKSYHDLGLSLAKQCLLEGVSLFAMFAMLLNFSRGGKMMGMSDINLWSIKDESIHVRGNSALFRQFVSEHPRIVNDEFKKEIYEMARKIVEMEDASIDRAFMMKSSSGSGDNAITKDEVKQYVRSVCDYRMIQLGLKPQFNVANPFEWLNWVTSSNMIENFFETNSVSYSKNSMVGTYDAGY